MQKEHVILLFALLLALLCVCDVSARGLPYSSRTKRISSDQRMAELQALLAMSYQPSGGIGHGLVDTYNAGKRKRSFDDTPTDETLLEMLERLSTYIGNTDS